jgi:hypothetical protein
MLVGSEAMLGKEKRGTHLCRCLLVIKIKTHG